MRFSSSFFERQSKTKNVHPDVEVSESNGIRSLHLGGNSTIQSSMRVSSPNELVLGYTRSMMAFLLFESFPRKVAIIGLGGGSIGKFFYHYFKLTQVINIELNPTVLNIAKQHFCLPEESERFQILLGDGAEFVAHKHPEPLDILIVDGYGSKSIAPSLSSLEFYQRCASNVLSHFGILIVNLWGSDKRFPIYLDRIQTAFNHRVLVLPAEKHGNMIIFAFMQEYNDPKWADLIEKAQRLEKKYDLEFVQFVNSLRKRNQYNSDCLFI